MLLIEPFVCNFFRENTFLVYDDSSRECVVIDCGCYTDEERDALRNFIDLNKLFVKKLINTHLHIDHAVGNRFAFEAFGVRPEAAEADAFLLEQMPLQAQMLGFPLRDEPMSLGGFLSEGDRFSVGEYEFRVLAVPGHSPGGLVFYCESEQLAFVGDSIFRESVGRTDFLLGDHAALVANLRTKILTLPPQTTLIPGHGAFTTVAHELLHNPFLTGE